MQEEVVVISRELGLLMKLSKIVQGCLLLPFSVKETAALCFVLGHEAAAIPGCGNITGTHETGSPQQVCCSHASRCVSREFQV